MKKKVSRLPDFYEVQRRQWRKSLFIFIVLILFYFAAFALVTLAILASVTFFLASPLVWSAASLVKGAIAVFLVALGIALLHFHEARRTGASYILTRLQAQPPDPSDYYHYQFSNVVEEMRIACGLPKVKAYVLPQFAVNSAALVECDSTPSIIVTEGLLADLTRDELQAVVAHELAHISRGDAFSVTLVCSLANFLEKMREALEPEDKSPDEGAGQRKAGGPPALPYFAVIFSSLVMHLLSSLLSRERETLADAAAVEICRHPQALARALYKAHLKSSLIGDFGLAYSPLFIVAPGLTGESEGFFSRLFNSHPPLMKRVRLLAQMAGLEPADILRQVWEEKKRREKARTVLVHHETEDIEARAREFPQIRLAIDERQKKGYLTPSPSGRCPRCHIPLSETFYEGVDIQACPRCRGKLVNASKMERILLRREFDFSADLIEKAKALREQFLLNPIKRQRIKEKEARGFTCPNCGYPLQPRPYNYQYFIPVDKCLACGAIWFEADELEILQVLVEKKI